VSWVPESALLVEVPEAEPLVGSWRQRHDPVAARGIPAHVTALYEFRPPADIDDEVCRQVAAVVAAEPVFSATFARIEVFDGVAVWLAPEPEDRFRALHRRLLEAFPDCQPYQGRFPDPQPHLTVAQGPPDGDAAAFAALEAAVRADLAPRLPLHTTVEAVSLFTSDDHGRWTRMARFGLRGADDRAGPLT